MMRRVFVSLLITAFLFAGCSLVNETEPAETSAAVTDASEDTEELLYRQITQEEAKQIMAEEEDIIILDVRTQEEFDEGHIPGAICIPYDSIEDDNIPQIPDKEQIILVYCRSGRRSKIASQNLGEMGYTNVFEFGGIIDWIGDVER